MSCVWMQAVAEFAELPSSKLQVPGVMQPSKTAKQGVHRISVTFKSMQLLVTYLLMEVLPVKKVWSILSEVCDNQAVSRFACRVNEMVS